MTTWFSQLIPAAEKETLGALHRGRVALAVGGVPAHWPEHFLRTGTAPEELVRAMRACELGRAPAIRLSHMASARPVAAHGSRTEAWYLRPFSRGAAVLQRVISVVSAAFAGGR